MKSKNDIVKEINRYLPLLTTKQQEIVLSIIKEFIKLKRSADKVAKRRQILANIDESIDFVKKHQKEKGISEAS